MKLLSPEIYQSELAKRYASIAAKLHLLVPFAKLEHIGASSIPGAISKADLDICMIVDAAQLEEVVQTLKQHAYIEKADTLRTEELCMLEYALPNEEHAVQVVANGSRFEEFFITFRKLLRTKPELLAQYNQIKLNSAPLGAVQYREAKSNFISAILSLHKTI